MRHLSILPHFLLAPALLLPARAAPPALQFVDGEAGLFSGRAATLRVQITSPEAANGRLYVSVFLAGATICRRDLGADAPAGNPVVVPVELELPTLATGVVQTATCEVRLILPGQDAVTITQALHLFPPDPWAGRVEETRRARLHVFDPSGELLDRLTQAGLPFARVPSVAALANSTNGTVLVAEGLSLAEYRALPDAMSAAAAAGARVLCLAPVEGLSALPGASTDDAPRPSLHLTGPEILSGFDKHLDPRMWGDKSSVSASWHPAPERRRMEGEWRPGEGGWSWIEARWPGGGSLTYCGFAVMRAWETSPAPRYFLAAWLRPPAVTPSSAPPQPHPPETTP